MPLCSDCRSKATTTGTDDPIRPGEGLQPGETCDRCKATNNREVNDRGLVLTNPHVIVYATTEDGEKKRVSLCMIERLGYYELSDGTVPSDMPEYNDPVGAGCHSDWRDGCPHGGKP